MVADNVVDGTVDVVEDDVDVCSAIIVDSNIDV